MPVMRQFAAAVSALAGSVFVLAACRGCSSADGVPGTQQDDAGSDVDARRDALTDPKHEPDAFSEDPADAALDSLVQHEGVPPGWEAWTVWSAACPIYIPGPGAELPPPIEWEPCPAALTLQSACRVMKNTWAGSTSISTRFWRDPSSGTPLLKFARPSSIGGVQLVPFIIAEIDGKVRHAHLYPLSYDVPSDCGYFEEDFNDGLYVLDAPARQQTGPDFGSGTIDGVIGGPMGNAVPSVLALTKENSSWRISADWLVQLTLGKVNAWTWDGNLSHNVYAGGNDPDGLQPHVPIVRGKDIFFTVGGLQLCGVMSWTPDAGLRPLLRWYGDTTRAAGNFGTDGKDMVWTQSQGAGACLNDAPNPDIWTAPYTTDPAELQATAHRVRKDVRGMSAESFVVANGFAARCDSFGVPPSLSLHIVRLTDGYSWIVQGDPAGKPHLLTKAIGMTESEVFVSGYVEGMSTTIFRIRLDSLGPGIPPD